MSGSPRPTDVAVVGAGVMGAATAYHVNRAGYRVMLLERHAVGHTRGSSHGTSRIFRLTYPDPELVALARESLSIWTRLEELHGSSLLLRTGSLVLGALVDADATALDRVGSRYERLPGREAGWRWPIAFDDDEDVLFQPDGATILADRAHRMFLDESLGGGVELLEHTPARALVPHREGVRIATDAEELDAAAVVVTAGAWTKALVAPLGIELEVRVTRESVAHYGLADADELPAIIDGAVPTAGGAAGERPEQISYAVASPGIGLKVGLHDSGPVVGPDEPGEPDDAAVRWASSWAGRRFPQLDTSPIAAETCLYTSTPDARFVLERHGRVVVGSACSGHGFKFAPIVGRHLAELAAQAVEG